MHKGWHATDLVIIEGLLVRRAQHHVDLGDLLEVEKIELGI